MELFHYPAVQRERFVCPGGEVQDDWNGMGEIILRTSEQSTGHVQQEGTLACPRGTQDEQAALCQIVGFDNRGSSRQGMLFWCLEALKDELAGGPYQVTALVEPKSQHGP